MSRWKRSRSWHSLFKTDGYISIPSICCGIDLDSACLKKLIADIFSKIITTTTIVDLKRLFHISRDHYHFQRQMRARLRFGSLLGVILDIHTDNYGKGKKRARKEGKRECSPPFSY